AALCGCEVFCVRVRLSPIATLFPYTTLFRSSLGVIIGFLASFIFLGLSLNGLPLSNAYAIWAGLGTAFTAAVGVIVFYEEIAFRSEEHTSELQSRFDLVCRLLLEKKKSRRDY